MSKIFQTLTVNVEMGNTYWQKAQDSIEDAEKHASKYTRNLADKYIYDVSYGEGNPRKIILVKTILHRE